MKKIIALTGGISSGKSAAAAAFKKAGAFVICADKLAAKHFDANAAKIQKYFKTAERKKIAQIIFKNAAKRKRLENLLHPLILKEAQALIKKSPAQTIVFDAPLLFEAGLQKSFDFILCIYCAQKTRLKRTSFTPADFAAREAAQIPLELKAAKSDFVIYNEGSKKELQQKVSKLCKLINEDNNGK